MCVCNNDNNVYVLFDRNTYIETVSRFWSLLAKVSANTSAHTVDKETIGTFFKRYDGKTGEPPEHAIRSHYTSFDFIHYTHQANNPFYEIAYGWLKCEKYVGNIFETAGD